MATRKPSAGGSAEEFYQQARSLWADAVDLGLYDDPAALRRAAGILQKAVRQDPSHAGALGLLADLLAALTAYAEAEEFALRVQEIEPEPEEHRRRLELLALPNGPDKRQAIMAHLARKWHGSGW
jgi:hypothetical protein